MNEKTEKYVFDKIVSDKPLRYPFVIDVAPRLHFGGYALPMMVRCIRGGFDVGLAKNWDAGIKAR